MRPVKVEILIGGSSALSEVFRDRVKDLSTPESGFAYFAKRVAILNADGAHTVDRANIRYSGLSTCCRPTVFYMFKVDFMLLVKLYSVWIGCPYMNITQKKIDECSFPLYTI